MTQEDGPVGVKYFTKNALAVYHKPASDLPDDQVFPVLHQELLGESAVKGWDIVGVVVALNDDGDTTKIKMLYHHWDELPVATGVVACPVL